MLTRRNVLTMGAGLTGSLAIDGLRGPVLAQQWPSQTVRIIVPFPPGGSADLSARLIADDLRMRIGQAVIVDNRPGAGGNIAAAAAARSAPDGYTIYLGTNGTQTINSFLYKQPGFDPDRDFKALAMVWEAPNVLVAHPSIAGTVGDLIALARTDPGRLNFGSSGIGSTTHLAAEQFMARTGTRMTHVPFRGQGPAIIDLIAGRVPVMFPLVPDIIGQVQSGAVRALAVASEARSPFLSDVPTLTEAGLPNLLASAWIGFFLPSATPPAIAATIDTALAAALAAPALATKLRELSIMSTPLSGEAFAAKIVRERVAWAELIGRLALTVE